MAKAQDVVLAVDELAVYLKLSKSSLYHFARRGTVRNQKIGVVGDSTRTLSMPG